jgi:tRNA(Ile)-lysidine synthetase-like protein
MLLDYKFDTSATYLTACSFGPDSMALLDMLQKSGVKPIVCFIAYRDNLQCQEALNGLTTYCQERGLTLEVFDTASVPPAPEGQFKEWSKKIRYEFFKRIYAKYDASALFIAHQQDDLIERYLIEKQNGKKLGDYGLTPIGTYEDMIVVRPLLSFSKNDLLMYDNENHIPYSVDQAKFENQNQRSQIRHDVVEKLNEVERGQILDKIEAENDDKLGYIKHLQTSSQSDESLNIREIMALDEDEFTDVLVRFVSTSNYHVKLTAKKVQDIRKFCLNPESVGTYQLKDKLYLVKEYDTLTLDDKIDTLPYTYVLEKPGKLENPDFDLDFSMGAEDRGISASDYPLTIRTPLPGDQCVYGGFLLPIRKLFMDAGVPANLRQIWPIFLNKDGKIVYVPRYRKDFSETYKSVLHIHPADGEEAKTL